MKPIIFLYFVIVSSFIIYPSHAANPQDAEIFVQKMADEAFSFLGDKKLSKNKKEEAFSKLLNDRFSIPTIARFALGRHWRTATPAERDNYMTLFNTLIIKMYARRFNDYSGENLVISGSRTERKGDITIFSQIEGQTGTPVKIDWRVREKNGRMKIIDVVIEGVSMSVTQRADFNAIIEKEKGAVSALNSYLREEIALK